MKTANKNMGPNCAICYKNEAVTLEDVNLGLYRCGECGHVFKNIPKESQEKYSEAYFLDEHKNWFNNPDYLLFESIFNDISKLKGGGRLKILDAGCGKGDFLKYLRKQNPQFELYGIDLTENEHPGIRFIKGDILGDEIRTRFDVICNLAVIEHIDDPYLFIERLKSLLNPDGIIFTVTDNDDSMIYGLARLLKNLGINAAYNRLYSSHHLQCFSNKSLKTLIETNGLDLIKQRNHNHPVEAVDYPQASPVITAAYMLMVRLIFLFSTIFNNGILQTAVCKEKRHGR